MTKTKLKPCPFCGGKAKLIELKQDSESWICCTECGARTRFFLNRGVVAVSAWNARSIEEKQAERIKYLQKERAEAIEQNYKNAFDILMQAERGAKYVLKENARLREALELIAKTKFYFARGEEEKQIRRVCEIAEEALKGKEE